MRRCISLECCCNHSCRFVSQGLFVGDLQWAYRGGRFKCTAPLFHKSRSLNAADQPSYNFTFACLAHPQQPNHSAWMRGLRPSSTAKQKTLVVHGCHSVPSIGQRRRFVGVKSGVTIWIFYERQCACIYVCTWLLQVLFIICFVWFFVLNKSNNETMMILESWTARLTADIVNEEGGRGGRGGAGCWGGRSPSVTSSQSSVSMVSSSRGLFYFNFFFGWVAKKVKCGVIDFDVF